MKQLQQGKIKPQQKKVNKLEQEVQDLKNMLEQAEKKCNQKEIIQMRKALVTIKHIMNSYIYPDMANAVLKKDDLLEVVNSVIPDELANKMIFYVYSEINAKDKVKATKKINNKSNAKTNVESTGIEGTRITSM